MRKVFIGILGIITLAFVGLIAFGVYWFLNDFRKNEDITKKPWIEHKFYTDRLLVDVPWKLKAKDLENNNTRVDGRMDRYNQNKIEVITIVSAANPTANFKAIPDVMIQQFKSDPEITVVTIRREEVSVLDRQAAVIYMTSRDKIRREFESRILLFEFENRLYQLHFTAPAGNTNNEKAWERMLGSIRLANPSETAAKGVSPNSKVVAPNSKDVVPNSKDVVPNSKSVVPNSKSVVPTSKGAGPTSKDVSPTSKEWLPKGMSRE